MLSPRRDRLLARLIGPSRMLRHKVSAVAVTLASSGWLIGAAAVAASPSAVAVVGNAHVGSDVIRSYFHGGHGGAIGDAKISEAIKALYATNLFSDVRVSRTPAGLRVMVVENSTLVRVAFEGNKAVEDKQLQSLVRSKAGGPLSRPLVHGDVERILAFYRRQGRLTARVDPQTIRGRNGTVSLIFAIDEGARIGISDIRFSGNTAFSSDRLKNVIKSGETNPLSRLLNNDYYAAEKAEADCDLLRRFYRAHGFAEAQARVALPQYDAGKKGLIVTFKVEEGPLYRFGAVGITSHVAAVKPTQLNDLVTLRQGAAFNADAIDKAVEAMAMDLARRGEPFTTVKATTEKTHGNTVNVDFAVEPGRRVYVERIEVHGNKKTQDKVIRREIAFDEGGPYNPALVQVSERQLKRLGYFKTVKFSEKKGSAPDRVVVDVTVEEQDTGQFTVSGGYSDSAGAIATMSLGERNFRGSGETVKLSLDYGQYVKGFNFGFAEPYPLGAHMPVGVNLFARESEANSNQAYASLVYGGKIGVTTPLNDQLGLEWHYGLSNQSLTLDPSLGIASAPVQQAAAAGPMWVSAAGSTVSYSTLDDPRHPTEGLRADVTNDVAGLGGDVKFLRNTDDVRFYRPVTSDIISLSRAQTGYIAPWGGQSLPLLNGFFGGPQLVRGFAVNGFGPRDITPGTTMDNVGGNAYWALSQELQAPIPMLPPVFQLKAAVFADAGSLWGTGVSNYGPALSQSMVSNSRAVRSSFGVGLIWDSILGPLRVDYAYPLTKGPYDITQRLHFGYGPF